MKKLITIVLILAMLLPAAALSEPDPIVGTWYANFIISGSPMESSVPDYDSSVIMLTFSDDGIIGFLELDFAGSKMDTNGYSQIGKWEKKGTEYEISIISVGVSNATIKDGKLNAALFQADMYMELRKLETFNFYTEMYRK